MTVHSELTRCSDAMADAVAALLPSDADPSRLTTFRAALGDLLAATLGGATVMAAGAVVALDTKVERLANSRGQRLLEIERDMNRIVARINKLEDEFLSDGQVGRLSEAAVRLALDVERLKERAAT